MYFLHDILDDKKYIFILSFIFHQVRLGVSGNEGIMVKILLETRGLEENKPRKIRTKPVFLIVQ